MHAPGSASASGVQTDAGPRRDVLQTMMTNEVAAGNERGDFRTVDEAQATRAIPVLCRSVADRYVPKGPTTPASISTQYVRYLLALVGDTKTRST